MTTAPRPWAAVVLDAWRAGQRLAAVGPGPVEAHLDHARAVAAVVATRDDVQRGLDLGTGVGLPGLALAGLLPELSWLLLDASARRIAIARSAIAELGWSPRVAAVHGRAEDLDPGSGFDVVVARSFGPPAVTAECAAPLVRVGGRVLVTEPPGEVEVEDRWPGAAMRPLGLRPGARTTDPAIQVLDAVAAPDARFPRRAGVAAKRPLW